MPSRWMREGYLSSEKINTLSDGAEVLYVRLLLIVDDYGHYWADPTAVRVGCFPAPPLGDGSGKRFSTQRTKRLLAELESADLIRFYVYGKRRYLEITNWKNSRPRQPKFPLPPWAKPHHAVKKSAVSVQDEHSSCQNTAQTLTERGPAVKKNNSDFNRAGSSRESKSPENSRENEKTNWPTKSKRQSNANRMHALNNYIRQRYTHTLKNNLMVNKNPSNRVIENPEKSENEKSDSPALKIFSDAAGKYPCLRAISSDRAARLFRDFPGADFAKCLEQTAAILEADTSGRMNAYITLRREMSMNEKDAVINAQMKGKNDKPLEQRSVWELKTLLELAQEQLSELQQYADPPDERLKDREPRYYARSLKRHEEYKAAKKRVKKLKKVLLSKGGG